MKKINSSGFTLVEALIVFGLLAITALVALTAYSQIGSKDKIARDSTLTESLNKAKQALGDFVTANKTIPESLTVDQGVSYSRKDNQVAELCATFEQQRSGAKDRGLNPFNALKHKVSATTTHQVYRDSVDFAAHTAGRNCYVINYAPINEAYNTKYDGQKNNHKVCDAYRQYKSKLTGQTIKGFVIGGPFTSTPGAAGGRLVLAQDVDAYDSTCKKIPVSDLKVGDKVELYLEDGPRSGSETTLFVKAIKKEL